jgi:hypothetical protein
MPTPKQHPIHLLPASACAAPETSKQHCGAAATFDDVGNSDGGQLPVRLTAALQLSAAIQTNKADIINAIEW